MEPNQICANKSWTMMYPLHVALDNTYNVVRINSIVCISLYINRRLSFNRNVDIQLSAYHMYLEWRAVLKDWVSLLIKLIPENAVLNRQCCLHLRPVITNVRYFGWLQIINRNGQQNSKTFAIVSYSFTCSCYFGFDM